MEIRVFSYVCPLAACVYGTYVCMIVRCCFCILAPALCMQVCMYACIHLCMHAIMYVYMHASMDACMHVSMYACMHRWTHDFFEELNLCFIVWFRDTTTACICLWMCMYACMHVCVYTHTCTHVTAHVYFACICVYIRLHLLLALECIASETQNWKKYVWQHWWFDILCWCVCIYAYI